MIMVRAIVRPEKTADIMHSLMEAGYPARHQDRGGGKRQTAGP